MPAQPLATALRDYGRAADRQLIYTDELVRGRQAPALKGRHEPSAALNLLLTGTDLTWRRASSGGIMIVRRSDNPQSGAAVGYEGTEPPRPVEEVVVVGSRLARSTDGPLPVTIIDQEKLNRLGATNVADVLKYLPQQTFSVPEWQGQGGARRVQLRGLAAGTTLVLINGRRVVPGAIGSAGNFFDLNTIPLPAVERIEVLSDSASAIYGADAVAGVVNIVLKSTIERPVLDLYYGAAEGGADERRVSLSVGGQTERARGSVTLDYFRRNELFGSDRERVGDADYRRFGGVDRRVATANPGNICSASGANLPGLPTPCAAVPVGSTGVGLTPSSFLTTAGQRNLESASRYRAFVPWSERYSATASGSWDLADHLTAFGEVIYSEREDLLTTGRATLSRAVVPATNPFNPFGVPVLADFLLPGITRTGPSQEKWQRVVLGVKGELQSWDWELSILDTKSDGDFANTGNLSAARVTAALNATMPGEALNVFQHGPGGSPELMNSLVLPTIPTIYSSKSRQFSGFARGDLFRLPGGVVQIVAGGEWRHEAISAISSAATISADRANRESWSAYSEIGIPLLGSDAGLPLFHELTLTVAGRYDHYSDFGGTFNAQYGLAWRPIPSVLLRGSYGESFRAPGLTELYQPVTGPLQATFFDPRRGGASTTAANTFGGNPDLEPETSDSMTVGIVWTPGLPGRPRFSMSYWRIEQDQRILTSVPILALLTNEGHFPDRVARAAPTAADLAAGWPGRVLSINTTLLNAGRLETSGVDLQATAAFETPLGRIIPTLSATRVENFKSADFPMTPFLQRVGVANFNGTVPRWRFVGSLSWSRGAWDATATARYTSEYDDTTFNTRNGRKVEGSALVDLQVSVDLGETLGDRRGLADGVVVRVGAVNVFDEEPPFSDVFGFGYDPTVADIRQRFVYVSLSKTF